MRALRVDDLGDDVAIKAKVGRSAAWLGLGRKVRVRGRGRGRVRVRVRVRVRLWGCVWALAPFHAHQCHPHGWLTSNQAEFLHRMLQRDTSCGDNDGLLPQIRALQLPELVAAGLTAGTGRAAPGRSTRRAS